MHVFIAVLISLTIITNGVVTSSMPPVSGSRDAYIAILKPPSLNPMTSTNMFSVDHIAASYGNILHMVNDAKPFAIDIHTPLDQEYSSFTAPHPHIPAITRFATSFTKPLSYHESDHSIPEKQGVHGFTFKGTNQEAEWVAAHDLVDFVEEDHPVSISQMQVPIPILTQNNTPSWGLSRVDQRYWNNDTDYNFPENAGANVTVYIIDTGVQVNSSEFVINNVTRAFWGKTLIDSTLNNTDDNGHGTFVAGIIGGNTYGVAKNCTIIAVKALNEDGSGTSSGLVRGIEWVVRAWNNTKNASIINISAASPTSRAINTVTNMVVNMGIPIVVAAGNSGSDACQYSPASAVAAITVGATNINDRIAHFSNFGPCVDMFAPGVAVTSISLNRSKSSSTGSGTSFSAPYVTGSLANYWGVNTSQSATEVMNTFGTNSTSNVVYGINWFSNTPNRFVFSLPPQVSG